MRYSAGTDTEPKLTALLAAAQDEPVFIEKDQKDVAVLVSSREYDRLSASANLDLPSSSATRLQKGLPPRVSQKTN